MDTCWLREHATGDDVPRTAVVGLGNPYHGDDAVGLIVARRVHHTLGRRGAVDLLEPSSSGFALSESLVGYQRAVIIDALVDSDADVGSVRRLEVSECYGRAPLTPHTGGFDEGLAIARAAGLEVPSVITLHGVVIREPQCFAEGLSRELESRLPTIVAAIAGAEIVARGGQRAEACGVLKDGHTGEATDANT